MLNMHGAYLFCQLQRSGGQESDRNMTNNMCSGRFSIVLVSRQGIWHSYYNAKIMYTEIEMLATFVSSTFLLFWIMTRHHEAVLARYSHRCFLQVSLCVCVKTTRNLKSVVNSSCIEARLEEEFERKAENSFEL